MLFLFLCTKSKQIVMRKFLYVFLVCFVGLYACVDDNLSLGKSLVDSSFYNVYADTCTVDISTVLLDSIETRGIVFVSLAITRIRYGEKYSRLIMPSIRKLVLHLMRIMPIALIHWC